MAQKVVGYIKLQIPAGKATPAPPVGPALGQHGVNIMAFTKEFNERTKNDVGLIIPVVITVYADRTFSFITKTPPAAVLIKKAINAIKPEIMLVEIGGTVGDIESQPFLEAIRQLKTQLAQNERCQYRYRHQHDCRYRPQHGRRSRRLNAFL